ncbi:MAG TPA: hypothetical protein DCZ93_10780 [Elusimicrobia bacterium]|nr:MAG: hypothetical protein A2X35_04715 [Elusimicrobia bacterium GWA2_61_42]OGR76641.1 MAG: hypothetical protein A2X38_03630 [Elusimicrobia bacterium GWC2_61_25]HBB67759.1 hypothetical protein [Elusimicrobiota bacterium]
MKSLLYTILLLSPAFCQADTFILNDGAMLEGEITGEMDGALLVKTKYGSLTINKADIKEQKAAQQPAPPPAAPEAAVSTSAAVEISTAPPAAEPPLKLTFSTVLPSTSTRLLVYSENGVAIATETFDASGAFVGLEGFVKDGTYTESYDNGALRTVKTLSGGKASGTFKAYYPSGAVQIEAYYLAGSKEGPFKYYAEDGKPVMEASYKNDKLNGWKKEFDAAGALKLENYYADDHMAEPPKPAGEAGPPKEADSMVTVKTLALARGERFSFQLNGKYIGKAHLDKDFNIISQDGKIPDGAIKVYSRDGKLQKEFVFENNAVKLLRVYEPGGPMKAEYAYKEDKAIKK